MKTRKHFIVMAFIAIIALALAIIGCKQDASPTPIANMEYKLGDTGPGGGKIFYVSKTGFTMTDDSQVCHYLEAAPSDQGTTLAWASNKDSVGTGTAIGTGRKNTALILTTEANAPAAKACKEYTGGSKTDWFLPSKDELNELYKNRTSVGNMGTAYNASSYYWSSSQIDENKAWVFIFSNGYPSDYYKDTNYPVRAIRVF